MKYKIKRNFNIFNLTFVLIFCKVLHKYFYYKDSFYFEKINSENLIKASSNNNVVNIVNPFKILNDYKEDDLLLEELSCFLYLLPITNKLFVSSNLYGHELIRYYDF